MIPHRCPLCGGSGGGPGPDCRGCCGTGIVWLLTGKQQTQTADAENLIQILPDGRVEFIARRIDARTLLAGLALRALTDEFGTELDGKQVMARHAVEYADVLLAELAKPRLTDKP